MSEYGAPILTHSTDVLFHAGNPDLLNLDAAQALLEMRKEQELLLSKEVAPTLPHVFIAAVGQAVYARRRELLDNTLDIRDDFDLAA